MSVAYAFMYLAVYACVYLMPICVRVRACVCGCIIMSVWVHTAYVCVCVWLYVYVCLLPVSRFICAIMMSGE